MDLGNRILMCMTCPNAGTPAAGRQVCGLSGRLTHQHAQEARCPAGKYQRGLGDWIAWLIERMAPVPVPKCGPCAKRRSQANRRGAGLLNWLTEWTTI